jgi:transposase
MFVETDAAFRAVIEGLDFSPYQPKITGFIPDPRVFPERPGDWTYPSVAISRYMTAYDYSRTRVEEKMVVEYLNGDVVMIDYPKPWIIGYQIDLRSSENTKTMHYEIAKLQEKVMSLCPGFIMDVTWNLDAYTAVGKVETRLAETPADMGDAEGRHFRVVYRFEAFTWQFDLSTLETIGRIKYRLFELADPPDGITVYHTVDPDGHG